MTAEPFTLLLPVYSGDHSEFFVRAFTSSVDEQTRKPSEVVVVQDGPIDSSLTDAIHAVSKKSTVSVTHLILDENVGLATALDRGLRACAHDIVARIDADDISLPRRFEQQLPLIESGADLVGSGMFEFEHDNGTIVGQRVPHVGGDAIARYARFHDPFSHQVGS